MPFSREFVSEIVISVADNKFEIHTEIVLDDVELVTSQINDELK